MSEKKKINFDLLNQSILDEEEKALSEYPFMRLAALLISFGLKDFHRMYGQVMGDKLSEEDREILLEYSVFHGQADLYSLKDYERKEILRDMEEEDQIKVHLMKMKGIEKGESQIFYEKVLAEKTLDLTPLTSKELVLALRFVDWFSKTSYDLPDKEAINALIKRDSLLRPFSTLTENFQGRTKELDQIRTYVSKTGQTDPLLISGIGGIGKSTLLAKFILDFVEEDKANKVPFIYLDFDRPGLSISEPLQLVSEGLRQLKVQFPELSELFTDMRHDIQTYLRSDRQSKYVDIEQMSKSNVGSRNLIYDSITSQYLDRFRYDLEKISRPVLWILDSFEEAQYRATITDLNNLFEFLREVSGVISSFRPIIIGRSDMVSAYGNFERMVLTSFDKASTMAYLEALEINNRDLVEEIADRIGGNPLTIQLAAQVVKQEAKAQGKSIAKLNGKELFDKIDEGRIQEHLVRRNLDHIHNDRVRQLAVPGLLVRKISSDVIQHVLAEPCGLGKIDAADAWQLYQDLQQESFLITESHGSLSFRQDLRIALYDLIIQDKEVKSQEIHENAIAFYQDKTAPQDQAEYLYHRLKRGDDPAIIEELYSDKIRPFIENSLTELPLNAYILLANKLNITVDDEVLKNASAASLEPYLINLVEEVFKEGHGDSLEEIERIFQRYPKRLDPSSLWYYEAKSALRLEKLDVYKDRIGRIMGAGVYGTKEALLEAQFYECEGKYEFSENVLDRSRKYESTGLKDRIALNIQSYICRARTNPKSGNNFLIPLDISDSEEEQGIPRNFIPRPYRAIDFDKNQRELQSQKLSSKDLEEFLYQIHQMLLPDTQYRRILEALEQRLTSVKEIEELLFSRFSLTLVDISEAGSLKQNLHDLAKFLEQRDVSEYADLVGEGMEKVAESSYEEQLAMQDQINYIREMIAEGDLHGAFDSTRELLEKTDQIRFDTDLVLLWNRYQRTQSQSKKGVIDEKAQIRAINRYSEALLDFLDRVESGLNPEA
ncbi:MAG: AAA family ATPase [Bacteroidia bacterium]|nr:AAA family ATPase [Bacteroidia bacterium]